VVLPWIDTFDGTPVLDLKPYIPISDRIRDFKVAEWLADWPDWMEDAGEYIAQHEVEDVALTYLYHTFVPKSGLTPGEPLEIEHFGEQRAILIPVQIPQKRSNFSSKKLGASNENEQI